MRWVWRRGDHRLLMQFQPDILGSPVAAPAVAEITATGASYAAGLATGVWSGLDELRATTPSRGAGSLGSTTTRAPPDWPAGAEESTVPSGWPHRSSSVQVPRNGREPGLPESLVREDGRAEGGGEGQRAR
jgi:hypothetical protein